MTSKLKALCGCSSRHLQVTGHIVAATQLVYKAVVTTTIRLQFDYRSTTVRLQFDLDDHSMTVGLSVCAAALRPQ